jgi:Spy/CpxP family protein refolding chaperone
MRASTTTIFSLAAIALAIATTQMMKSEPSASLEISPEVMVAYKQWKGKHQKLFATPSEDLYRLSIFAKNYQMVKASKSENLSYTLGLNKFAALTFKEFGLFVGFVGEDEPSSNDRMSQESRLTAAQEEKLRANFPDSVDWEAKKRVAYPRSLPNCPNVLAIIGAMMLETFKAIKDNRFPTRRSSQQLIDCFS